jgi:formate-dependent nitrite reductase membrane component NrfD
LAKGGYSFSIYGGLLTLWALTKWFGWSGIEMPLLWLTAIFAILTAIYTAFLFAQAKGRDFWQSPMLSLHMFGHSVAAGGAAFAILLLFAGAEPAWQEYLKSALYAAIGFNLVVMFFELATTHPTADAKKAVEMIVSGRYKMRFWLGAILIGNLIPLVLVASGSAVAMAAAGVLMLIGMYITEHIWVEAPQRIPLS